MGSLGWYIGGGVLVIAVSALFFKYRQVAKDRLTELYTKAVQMSAQAARDKEIAEAQLKLEAEERAKVEKAEHGLPTATLKDLLKEADQWDGK